MTARGPFLFCLLAGGGDAATGALLIVAPNLVLRLLGIEPPADDPIFLRWVGVFVGAVGLAYLAPWLSARESARQRRLLSAIETTAGIRLAVALFVGCAVGAGRLDLSWAVVGAYDAVVASLQVALLGRGVFGDIGGDVG